MYVLFFVWGGTQQHGKTLIGETATHVSRNMLEKLLAGNNNVWKTTPGGMLRKLLLLGEAPHAQATPQVSAQRTPSWQPP